MKAVVFAALSMLFCLRVAHAQGTYSVTVGGTTFVGEMAAGGVVKLGGVVLPNTTWEIIDADGDGKVDDIRVTDAGGGKLDLRDAKGVGPGVSGTAHDGNVEIWSDGAAAEPNRYVGEDLNGHRPRTASVLPRQTRAAACS